MNDGEGRVSILSSDRHVYDWFDSAVVSKMETKWDQVAKAHWWSEELRVCGVEPKLRLLHAALSSGQSQLEVIYV